MTLRAINLKRDVVLFGALVTLAVFSGCHTEPIDGPVDTTQAEVEEREQALSALPLDYASVVVADGPAAYYRLDESTGSQAHDRSSKPHDGTYRGTHGDTFPPRLGDPGAIAGDPNTAAWFRAYNDYKYSPPGVQPFVEIARNDEQQVPTQAGLTLEAWFTMEPNVPQQSYAALVHKTTVAGLSADGYGIVQWNSTLWFYHSHWGSRVGVPLARINAPTSYHHIVGTYDGRMNSIYLDGELIDSKPASGPVNAGIASLKIGAGWYQFGWQGRIDEVALYHRGLTDVEVREHYDAGKTNMSFEISVPAHLDISDVALLGEQVIVGDGARVFDAVTAQPSALAATGAGGITLGADARSGALNSAGGALLRSGALAVGPVQLAGALSLESRAEVRGSVVQNAAAEPPRVLRWDVRWPSFSSGAIKLSPSQTSSAGPGRYRDVVLGTGAQLALSAGAYYFDSLSLDADARLYVDNASGPVRVFVRDALTYRGRIERNHQASNVLLVYLGSRNVSVEGDFDASLWAPNAVLTLHPQPSVHRGSFIGKKVNVLANARVERSPYRMLQCMGEDCQGGAAEPPLNASCSEEGLLVRRLRLDGPLANTADWVCVLSRIGGELDEETNSSEHYARLSIQKDYWSGYQTHSDVSAEAICVHRSCLLSERLSASGPYTVSAVTGVTTVPIPAPPFSFDECHESSEDHKPGGPAEEASFISEFSVTEPEGGGERVWIDQISSSRATFHATNGQCGTVRGTSYSFRSTPAGRVALFHGPIAEHVAAEAAGTFTVRSAGNRETFMPPIDEALCFLTEFGGKIRGGGEYATIAPRFDPATKRTRWHLSAHHLSGGDPDGVFASARCYSTRQDACEALAPAERPDSCDARFRQRFSWHQDTGGEIDMGPADDRACFLVRSGGHFEGGGEIVHAHVERGRWALRGNSEQTGVNATAECVAAESLSPEVPWQQGEPAKDLGSATGRACFLTRMAGHFEGGGEAIFTRIENGHWFLEGRSSQDEGGVAASARCMPVVAVGAEVTWVRGEDPKVLSTSPEDFCFITHVEGKFKGGRERVEVLLERLADGSVRQLLQGDSGQTTIVGKARCVRLATDGVVSVPDPPPALPAPDCNIVETDSYSPTFASPAVCFMSLLTEDEEGETVTRSSCRPISCFERGNQGDKVAQTAQTRVAAGEDDFGDCKHVENPLLGPNTVSFLTDADMQEAEGGGERVWIDQAAELGTTTILHANSCQGSALFNDGTIFGHAASLQLRRLDRVVQYMGPDDRVGPLNVAGEFTVQSGGTPVERPMTPVSSTTCVLTAFSGKFEGGGEFIRLDHSGSRWKLIAQHRGGDGLTATARCFLNEQPPL